MRIIPYSLKKVLCHEGIRCTEFNSSLTPWRTSTAFDKYRHEIKESISKRLLPGIAAAHIVAKPTSQAFLSVCGLSASSVRSALSDLCAREIVYRSETGYVVYERLFAEWPTAFMAL